MEKSMSRTHEFPMSLRRFCRILVVLLLVTSGGAKLVLPATQPGAATLVPPVLLIPVALWEIGLAVLFAFWPKRWIDWAVSISGLAMLITTLFFVLSGHDVASCGCFGRVPVSPVAHAWFALAIAVFPLMPVAGADGRVGA